MLHNSVKKISCRSNHPQCIESTQNPGPYQENYELSHSLETRSSLIASKENNLAASWAGVKQILINNAAVTAPHRKESSDGIEFQFATNVLVYY